LRQHTRPSVCTKARSRTRVEFRAGPPDHLLKREILTRMQPLVDPGTVTDLPHPRGPWMRAREPENGESDDNLLPLGTVLRAHSAVSARRETERVQGFDERHVRTGLLGGRRRGCRRWLPPPWAVVVEIDLQARPVGLYRHGVMSSISARKLSSMCRADRAPATTSRMIPLARSRVSDRPSAPACPRSTPTDRTLIGTSTTSFCQRAAANPPTGRLDALQPRSPGRWRACCRWTPATARLAAYCAKRTAP